MLPRILLIALSLAPAGLFAAEPPLPASISFNRDIRPIMSDTCFHCHGFDAKTREAGLRLDLREEALKKTENDILPIVPGKPEQSEIIARIMDAKDPMPPDDAHKPLTPRQKALFRQWVAEGAVYEPHWAYAPLTRPALPPEPQLANPVDAFVQAKLAEKDIAPSDEAPKAKLLRRLSLDLIGLPPTPQEIAAFIKDSSGDSYTRQVERLLASPRFGERMAVWWLDIARFADTVGFHGDQNQRIFPYRDYVINAFNANKKFDQFTIEQLAGDLLPNPTPEQIVATGYNRLNMMTREGGAQAKEYLAKYGAERVRSVSAAWFGSTFGCAECHDHKFDPIKARDFYELQSFFADVKQWGVYSDYRYTPVPELVGFNNDYPFPPEIEVESPYLKKRFEAAKAKLRAHLVSSRSKLASQPSAAWEAEMKAFLAGHGDGWVTPEPTTRLLPVKAPEPARPAAKAATAKPAAAGKAAPKDPGFVREDGTIKLDRPLARGQSLEVTLPCSDLPQLSALRVSVVNDDIVAEKPTSLRVAASLLRADGKKQSLTVSMADSTEKFPSYKSGAEIMGIEGGWLLPVQLTKRQAHGVWVFDTPPALLPGDKVVLVLSGDSVRPLRISLSPLASVDPLRAASLVTRKAITTPPDQRDDRQKRQVLDAWFASAAPDQAALKTARELARAVRDLNEGRAWSLVTKAMEPIPVRVLPRGNWQDESGPVVLPATPSFLPARAESTPQKRLTRLDLANWIVSKDNPITARAVMNRLWQQFFGVGLSAVVDDLGSQGEPPSHPELLDWLASDFRDGGWDIKKMIRLLVTSHTYRQSSSLRLELKDIDPANRLLASQNPRRLEAEFVRDNALAIAGLLNVDDIGGPSVKPYQPEGYYEALQFPNREYIPAADRDQWRRGVYMHWQRTFLHPMLANFDAPARDECAALRTVSNTPQQALTLLNDPTFVEAARVLAARVLANQKLSDEQRLRYACRLTWSRAPKPKETASLAAFLASQRSHYRANSADAEKLMRVGIAPQPAVESAEAAAWTSLCRVLLNAQETITRY